MKYPVARNEKCARGAMKYPVAKNEKVRWDGMKYSVARNEKCAIAAMKYPVAKNEKVGWDGMKYSVARNEKCTTAAMKYPVAKHFSHPILGTYEVIQFLELANLEGTHSRVVYETHTYSMVLWDGNLIPFSSLSNTMPLHTIPLV